MSGMMRMVDEWDSRGYGEVEGTICSTCITDEALIATVRNEGDDRACDQCGTTPDGLDATVDLQRVVEIVVDGLLLEYDDPINESHYESAEGGYTVPHCDKYELLQNFDVVDELSVLHKIADTMTGDTWCQRGPYAETPTEALRYGWARYAKHTIEKQQGLTLTEDAGALLDAGALALDSVPQAVADAITDSGNLTTFKAGTQWWRARVHPPNETYTAAKDLGTPPDQFARANRMSAEGKGAFYGATTLDGARAEVAGYADAAQAATIGRFTQLTDLTLVDLRDYPSVPSLFDEDNRHRRPARQFMHDFIADVTKVAEPEDPDQRQYVPTQIIAAHLRNTLAVDGICWRSTKDRNVIVTVPFLHNSAMVDHGDTDSAGRLLLESGTLTVLLHL